MRGGTGCLLLLLAGAAQADQYSYVSAQRAAQAVQRLAGRVLVQVYCAPCAETRPRTLRLEQVGMERVWDGTSAQPCRAPDGATYWQVQVNGEADELAYVYVRAGVGWENFALGMGLDAVDVLRQLPPARAGG